MNYCVIYDRLIAKYQVETFEGYGEKHHILPKCLGGTDHNVNLVRLPARVHFVAHLLLAKIYGDNLVFAAWRMANNGRYTSRKYAWVRAKVAHRMSQITSQSMKGNTHTRGQKRSVEFCKNISEVNKGNQNARGNSFTLTAEQRQKVSLSKLGNQATKGMRFKYIEGKKVRIA